MPDTSARIKAYLTERGVDVTGCCRVNHAALEPGVTPVTICQTCRIIIEENHPDAGCMSLFEYIDSLPDFPFRDFGGETMILQDCFRSAHHTAERAAVRSLLRKLNIRAVEPLNSEAAQRFDGRFLLAEMRPGNLALAPRRFAELGKAATPMDDAAAQAYLSDYCAGLGGEAVVCYCNSCLQGLRDGFGGGARVRHLAELLFD